VARLKARSTAPIALSQVVPVVDGPRFGPTVGVLVAGARPVLLADVRWPLGVPMTGAVLAVAWPSFVAMSRPGVLDLALGRWLVLWPSLALAVALLVLFGVRAWREVRHPVDPVLAVWRSKVAGDRLQRDQKTPLPGSKVWGPVRRADWGWEMDGEGFGAVQGTDVVRKAVPAIAAAYQQPASAFEVLDRVGNGGFTVRFVDPVWAEDRDRAREARMTRTYPLGAQVLDRALGSCEVARQIDDDAPGLWELFRPRVGVRHGVFGGDTRYGKSTAMKTLATVACRSGIVVPHFVDLAGGVDFKEWDGVAGSYARDVDSGFLVFQALHREYQARMDLMDRRPGLGPVLDPSVDFPVHILFVDEGPELREHDRASGLLSQAVRLWAKAGLCVVFGTQSLTIEAVLHRKAGAAAKAQLMSGNKMIFYSDQGLAGLRFDVSDVPPVVGVARLQGPLHPASVMARGLYQDGPASGVQVPPFSWPAEPVLGRPDPAQRPVDRTLHVVKGRDRNADLDDLDLELARLGGAPGPARTIPAASSEDAVVQVLEDLGGSGSSTAVVRRSGLPQATAYAAFGRLRESGRAVSPRRGVWALRGHEVDR
jgi:hypothetical protein